MLDTALKLVAYIENNYPNRQPNDMHQAMQLVKSVTLGETFKDVFEVVDFYFAD